MFTIQARKKELMGKVSQAEHHVDLLQKEALGNLQLRMSEVGRSVTSLSITGMSVLNSYFGDMMFWLIELFNQSVGNRETQFAETQVKRRIPCETN